MGCFLSNGKVKVDREEATTVEDKKCNIQQSQMKRIRLMNIEEKVKLARSNELVEFLRLNHPSDRDVYSEVMEELTPQENTTLIKSLYKIDDSIMKQIAPPPQNIYHTQFISILHYYSINFRLFMLDYLKQNEQLQSTLQQSFNISSKTLLVLLALQDPNLKPEEKWWINNNSSTSINNTNGKNKSVQQQLEECKQLFDQQAQELANDYLAGLFGNLNLQTEKTDNTNHQSKEEITQQKISK